MKVSDVAAAAITPKVLNKFRWSWLAYGAAAYFGIRFLYNRGILPKQTGAALDVMDKGIDYAKRQVGIEPSPRSKRSDVEKQDLQTVH